jgi:hypothetical protein
MLLCLIGVLIHVPNQVGTVKHMLEGGDTAVHVGDLLECVASINENH